MRLFRPRRVSSAQLLIFVIGLVVSFMAGFEALPSYQTEAEPEDAREPIVHVRFDPNVETMGVLLALAFEDYGFGDFSLPVAARAQVQLADHRSHPAVVATREMVQQLGIDGYTILALRAEPFGGTRAGRLRAPLPADWAEGLGGGNEAAGRARVDTYLRQVVAFFRDAKVGAFLDAHRAAYDRAEQEVLRLAPDSSLISAMERYFGDRLERYTIVPTLTHPPHGNVGARLACGEEAGCRSAFFMVGARVSVPEPALMAGEAAGFYDATDPEASRRYVSDLALHEFGHAFVNPHLEQPELREAIEEHAGLMGPVRDRMAPQAYTAWFAVAIEHVLRTTEVRVALSVGDTARAERLRDEYVGDRAFVYLPWLEQAAARYEREGPNGTGRYPTFGAYASQMVQAFGDVDMAAVQRALGHGSGPVRAVTIRVEAPVPPSDTVFVTGGHTALGDWSPGSEPLRPTGDGVWTRTFSIEQGTRLEFKTTRGSWTTEAADDGGRPRPNAVLDVRGDTSVTVRVERWVDEPAP